MARIDTNKMKKLEKERNIVHSEIEATYTIFNDSGHKYFQIDTYGKPGRVNPGKCSQSLQFNYESAKFLVDLLCKEYNL